MPDWSLTEGQRWANAGAATTVSRGTSVTASGTANTKGAYAVLSAATPFDAHMIVVMIDDISTVIDYLLDIAVGAAGVEFVILPNLYVGGGTGSINYGAIYQFPVQIPKGVRLTARIQASTLSSVARVSCLLMQQSFSPGQPLGRVDAYGANTATSGGVSVDPGGTANTKGAYSQIIASTTHDMAAMCLAVGNQKNGTRASQSWLTDIAIGAAGAEQVLISNYSMNCSTSPDIVTPQTSPLLPVSIPAGTRLAVRTQSDGIVSPARLFDAIIYGVSA
jgi:hypothetical protein